MKLITLTVRHSILLLSFGLIGLVAACSKDNGTTNNPIAPITPQPENSAYHRINGAGWFSNPAVVNLKDVKRGRQLKPGTSCTVSGDTMTIVACTTVVNNGLLDTTALRLAFKVRPGYVGNYTLRYDRNTVDILKQGSVAFFGTAREWDQYFPTTASSDGTLTIKTYNAANKTITGDYNFVMTLLNLPPRTIAGGSLKTVIVQ